MTAKVCGAMAVDSVGFHKPGLTEAAAAFAGALHCEDLCAKPAPAGEGAEVLRLGEGVPVLVKLEEGPWGALAKIPHAKLPGLTDDAIAIVRAPFTHAAAAVTSSPLSSSLARLPGAVRAVAMSVDATRGKGRLVVDVYTHAESAYVLKRGSLGLVQFLKQEGMAIAFVPNAAVAANAAQAGTPCTACRGAMHGIAQSSNRVMMVSPTAFGYNAAAAADNTFMHADGVHADTTERACEEFEELHRMLTEDAGVDVQLFHHAPLHGTPDAVFPNNWFSSHAAGEAGGGVTRSTLALYPMKCANRAAERRPDIIAALDAIQPHDAVLDLAQVEREAPGTALEGTGALVLDRVNGVAYVSLSPRADKCTAERWATALGYRRLVAFRSCREPGGGGEIYHTNVMMAVGTGVAVVCAEAIEDDAERAMVLQALQETHAVVTISREQVDALCGNVLELKDRHGVPFIAMSSGARAAFTPAQRATLLEHVSALRSVPLNTIEHIGGGGVRCTLAELF